MVDSRTGVVNVRDDPGATWAAREKGKAKKKSQWWRPVKGKEGASDVQGQEMMRDAQIHEVTSDVQI